MPAFPILTYHSQNIFEDKSYAENDHVALAQDLELIYSLGHHVQPLTRLLEWLNGHKGAAELEKVVFLTFDDGCNFDVRDLEHPEFGLQRSFRAIMQDFARTLESNLADQLHATSFVIASDQARKLMDTHSLWGKNWISSDWWRQTDQEGLISIESHGWDHNHPDLGGDDRGGFEEIDNAPQCREQVVDAAQAIEAVTGRRPTLFAYPYGQSSAYMRESWFPGFKDLHGCQAAFGTEPEHVHSESDRWNLPRYVCGADWRSPEELQTLLESGRRPSSQDDFRPSK